MGMGGILAASATPLFTYGAENYPGSDRVNNTNGQRRKLGVALVGLGSYSTNQLAPALQQTKSCRLTGIVTGSPEKIPVWQRQYGIPDKNVYNYDNFDTIKDNPDIDIIYIVLPNGLHAEYTVRAAQAGKHVICEKPMAVSVSECEEMIEACRKADKKLSIGYRLHFEPYNKEMMRLGQNQVYGKVEFVKGKNGMIVPEGTWRTDKELAGGGPLMDLGIYCVQAAIYTSGKKPVAITAHEGEKTQPEKFSEVEQSIHWRMEFPDGLVANCDSSYSERMDLLRADAEKGWFELSPAYTYTGKQGRTSDGPMNFSQVFEQVYQMDDFADCIINNRQSPVPGEMGLRDVKILMAIYEAARTGKRVELNLEDDYVRQVLLKADR